MSSGYKDIIVVGGGSGVPFHEARCSGRATSGNARQTGIDEVRKDGIRISSTTQEEKSSENLGYHMEKVVIVRCTACVYQQKGPFEQVPAHSENVHWFPSTS